MTTKTWVGGILLPQPSGGSFAEWGLGGEWSPIGVPTANDDVFIGSGAAVEADPQYADPVARSVTIDGANITAGFGSVHFAALTIGPGVGQRGVTFDMVSDSVVRADPAAQVLISILSNSVVIGTLGDRPLIEGRDVFEAPPGVPNAGQFSPSIAARGAGPATLDGGYFNTGWNNGRFAGEAGFPGSIVANQTTDGSVFTLGPALTINFTLFTDIVASTVNPQVATVENQGLLNLAPGATVKTDGLVANTGAITLLSATLTVTHAAGFGGVIRFLDGNSLLSLGDAQPSATLSGLRAGDQVDLPGVAFAGAAIATTGNVLGITEGGAAAASLTLADQSALSPASFSLSADAAGGTLVSTTLAPGPLLGYLDGTNNDTGTIALDPVSAGAPSYLQHQYIDTSANSVSLSTTVPNVFLHAGSGNDALQAGSGQNVLDAGIGNSFMAGGSGTDTFFVDVRSGYHPVWDTIVNFRAGDSLTVWGFQGGKEGFNGQSGAVGYTGATLAVDLAGDGAHTARITLAGLSDAQASRLVVTAGAIGATPYLSVVDVAG